MKRQNLKNKMSIILICLAILNLFYSTDCYSKTKKIVMIIASSDFRDEEYKVPKAIFEKDGYSIIVASSSLSESTGMLGMKVKPNITLDKVIVDDYDAVVFVGGRGSEEYFTNTVAHKIAKDAFDKGKVLAAICIAPIILANAGLLKGKKATCNDSENLIKKGAHYTGKSVEQDGKIITGIGPESSKEFAETILRLLNTQ
jgi:protease I